MPKSFLLFMPQTGLSLAHRLCSQIHFGSQGLTPKKATWVSLALISMGFE